MNIIIDQSTFDQLKLYTIDTIVFGSEMKGSSSVNSDHDYLHIIHPSIDWASSPVNTNHLLQYKCEKEDHIFCTPQNFVKCLIDGDSTIFHEILRYGALKDTSLAFLNSFKFDHYKTLRSYLGIARRDTKETTKLYKSDKNKSLKKLKFASESYNYVQKITGKFSPFHLNEITDVQQLLSCANNLSERINKMRHSLNDDLDHNKIKRTVSNEELNLIDEHLRKISYESYTTGLEYFYKSHMDGN